MLLLDLDLKSRERRTGEEILPRITPIAVNLGHEKIRDLALTHHFLRRACPTYLYDCDFP